MNSALLIIDMQNDFISGSLAVPNGEELALGMSTVVPHLTYDFLVTTQDWHVDPGDHFSDDPDYVDSWPTHCVADTWGAELHEAIAGIEVDARFFKGHHSAAYSGFDGFDEDGEPLESWLKDRDVTHVSIIGIATDHCVKATAIDAARAGFGTVVLVGLTAAVSEEGSAAAIDEMTEAGVIV